MTFPLEARRVDASVALEEGLLNRPSLLRCAFYLNEDVLLVSASSRCARAANEGAPTWEQMGFARVGEFCLCHRSLRLRLEVANKHRDRPIDFDRVTNEKDGPHVDLLHAAEADAAHRWTLYEQLAALPVTHDPGPTSGVRRLHR